MNDVLELYEAPRAFERLEEWLRERGFFRAGGAHLMADLYLGYGLSRVLRRSTARLPPEPCALPLLACTVRSARHDVKNGNGVVEEGRVGDDAFEIGAWQRTWDAAAYGAAVDAVRGSIERGDVYQVNLVQHLSAPFSGNVRALASRLTPLGPDRPGPFVGSAWAVVSASPELFLARRGSRLWTCPIKGTRPAGQAAELASSRKDAAEHLMIVDLERNDLSRVCVAGSVRWPELMVTRRLAGVEHMVSTVEGTARIGVGLAAVLAATFPGGSVTGAPKIAAIDRIAELEPVGRGASMGALGWVRGDGDFHLGLTIRTFAIAAGRIHLWVGGGIVWDSEASAEVDESLTKARPLLAAVGAPLPETEAVPR